MRAAQRSLPLSRLWERATGEGKTTSPVHSKLGWTMGLEPTTTGITIRYSNQLSYAHHCQKSTGVLPEPACDGAPDRTRTCNRRLRRPMLYPVELRALRSSLTRLVGVEGFELSTSSSQSWRSTRLSYTPIVRRNRLAPPKFLPRDNSAWLADYVFHMRKRVPEHPSQSGAPGEIRTPDHQVRSLVLYPAELRARRSGIIRAH